MKNAMNETERLGLKDEDVDTILGSMIFQGVRKDELGMLLPCLNTQKKHFNKNEWIFHAGDEVTRIGLILSGSAHIERDDYWGNRHIVTALMPGDVFGESYAASKKNIINVSVQADDDMDVLFINVSDVLHMCSSACQFHNRLIENIVSLLAGHNLQLSEKLTYVTQHTMRDKILSYLSAESIRQHSSYFDIPFDRQQLADFLNIERSALSGELSKLKKEGILDYQKNHFHLLNDTVASS